MMQNISTAFKVSALSVPLLWQKAPGVTGSFRGIHVDDIIN